MHPISTYPLEPSPRLASPEFGPSMRGKPEWTDVHLGKNYSATLGVVEDQIIVFRPAGRGGLHEVRAGLRLVSEAAAEITDKGKSYVFLSDVSNSRGLTREARGYYSENMRNRRRLLGIIFFGASPALKLSIKIGKRFNYPGMDVKIAEDYPEALRLAWEMLSGDDRGGAVSARPPLPPEARPGGAPHIVTRDDWRMDEDGFSLRYEVIDGNILHTRGVGYFREKHIEPSTALRERVCAEVHPDGAFDYIVVAMNGLKGSSRRARIKYMNALEKWRESRPFHMYVVYGANMFVKTAMNLARPLMSFTIRTAEDLDDALAMIREHEKKRGGRATPPGEKDAAAEAPAPGRIQEFIDDLMRYIGSINWEKDGIDLKKRVDASHPFNPVFESIALIKAELDEHFRERERAEKALRESEARYREVLEHSRDILFKRNIQTEEYEYISHAVADLLGYSVQDLQNLGINDIKPLMHPEDVPGYEAFQNALFKTKSHDKTGHLIEYRLKRKDGAYRWFSDSHSVIRDSEGRPLFIIGNNRDVTERKKAEIALKERRERFLTVLDSMDAHVYVADMETYEILFMNKRMREEYGRDMVGEICWKAFHHNNAPCDHCSNHRLLDDRGKPTGVYIWEGKNPITNRWYLNHDRAVKWMDNRYVRMEIAADISRIKRLEEERRKAEERRRHARKLEAVGTMAEGIAHNFNNHLMAVMGNLDLMLSDLLPGSDMEINIRDAFDATRRAAELSTLMLTYVGQGKVSMKTLDMTETAGEIIDSLASSVLKKASLEIDFSSEPTLFKGDPGQVRQVIVNLLTNAAEALGENGGEVTVTAGKVFREKDWFRRQIMKEELPDGEYVYFEVTDRGAGMDEETAEKVLDPFFTTKFAGRGLGMAAVGGIMRSHAGAISLESEPGEGTEAKVLFPAMKNQIREAPKPAPPPPPRGGGAILLVDDEEIALTVGKAMLEKLGHRVLTAVDGLDAVETYRAAADEIRCVVLDINMPRMDGAEAFRELRRIDPDVRVLISSGFTEGGAADRFEGDAPAGFIHKPFNLKEFERKIGEVMG
ncbi:MAG: PAS domain S-box protein [Desulfobacterales bacterium]|nr:PAS domain S-box protein [Desulfobacterales bacterium]